MARLEELAFMVMDDAEMLDAVSRAAEQAQERLNQATGTRDRGGFAPAAVAGSREAISTINRAGREGLAGREVLDVQKKIAAEAGKQNHKLELIEKHLGEIARNSDSVLVW